MSTSCSRIGPCNTEAPEEMPLSKMIWPAPAQSDNVTGYAGEYEDDEGSDNYVQFPDNPAG